MQAFLNLPNPNAARESLFLSTDGQPFTTSRAVAERFGKLHKNVLKLIKTLLTDLPDPEFSRLNFEPRNFSYMTGKGQLRTDTEYLLTHDGFALLVMGFTGSDALVWKVAFLQAFRQLETELAATQAKYVAAMNIIRPNIRPVVEGTQAGLSRRQIAEPLGKSPAHVTRQRSQARRLGLLH